MAYVDLDTCDYRSRCFVNGVVKDKDGKSVPNSAHWHARFRHHPWVQQSDEEGWARELRGVVISNLKRRMLMAQGLFDYNKVSIEDLMPDSDWVAYTRKEAAKMADGLRWQSESGYDRNKRIDKVVLPDVSRPAFDKLMRESPNHGLHRTLSGLSKRMAGERE